MLRRLHRAPMTLHSLQIVRFPPSVAQGSQKPEMHSVQTNACFRPTGLRHSAHSTFGPASSEELETEWPEGVLGQMLGRVCAVCGGEGGMLVSTTARVVAASISSSQRDGNDDAELDEVVESSVLWRLRFCFGFTTRCCRGAGRV